MANTARNKAAKAVDVETVETVEPTDATPDAPTVEPDATEPTVEDVETETAAIHAARMEALLTTLSEAVKGHVIGNSSPLALALRAAVQGARPDVPQWQGGILDGVVPFEATETSDKEGNVKRGGKYAVPPRLKAMQHREAGLAYLGLKPTDTLAMWEPSDSELMSLLAETNKTEAAIKRATARDSATKKAREDAAKAATKSAVDVVRGMERAGMSGEIIDTPVRAVIAEALASGVITLDMVNTALEAGKLTFRLTVPTTTDTPAN
ncbi:hypothetical protein [Streptosporangium sp. NPDC001681]|uniref:hypothetical protein n=1 Tax=Streptosporangium sp. NPDC001681 TaxID=3154395 RepID=UPI003332331B